MFSQSIFILFTRIKRFDTKLVLYSIIKEPRKNESQKQHSIFSAFACNFLSFSHCCHFCFKPLSLCFISSLFAHTHSQSFSLKYANLLNAILSFSLIFYFSNYNTRKWRRESETYIRELHSLSISLSLF